ncbi:MAG: Alvin_2107 family globule sulfur oxidation protein [Acidiferrobacterales bacterium]
MSNVYYDTISKMEKSGVDSDYVNGWACGFLHNPKREEQRVSEAYDAGYNDGVSQKTDGFKSWVKK